ncbi:hypothetical protein ACFSQP_07545 [Bizionia sediminis]|uniref:Magnesium citrate secondary transporter n=1 Tax=Bizionia sediminis TaxID=1737064 RepID=A0ABW5KUZ1_9FLAO
MKILAQPVFYISIGIAASIYFAQRLNIPLPSWINNYVNDFLCMPIVLSISLAILRFIKKTEDLFVPLPVILGLTLYFSVYFEWFMPQVSARYTADFIDVGLYFIGALLFFRYQKRLF